MKLICIDARMWGIGHTGIGRYVESLVKSLPKDENYKLALIVSKEMAKSESLSAYTVYPVNYHPYSYLSQLEMLLVLVKIRPNLLHVPHFTIPLLWWGKMVITIHDLIKHLSRGPSTTTRHPILYWLKYVQYLFVVWFAVKRASHIIVPANYWKRELTQKFNIPSGKISVTYEGVTNMTMPDKLLIDKISLPKEPFLVYTGNLYPHKNVGVLIEVCKKLKMNLAIICARSVFQDRLPKSEFIHYLGKLSDHEIAYVYKNAFAFVFPSLIEGFGLPGLEAMTAGLPVISSNSSCLPEIYGDAVLYFEPRSEHDLELKIRLLLSDSKLKAKLIRQGHSQVTKYSWEKMGNETWQIYLKQLH